jgi:hypothetical protein
MEGNGSLIDPLEILRRQPVLWPLFLRLLHSNDWDLFLFPGKQYIINVRFVKGKKGFCQNVVNNRSSDVQKLFSVIRDSSRNIMYKIHVKSVPNNAKKQTK